MTSFLKPLASLPPSLSPAEMRESQIQFPTSYCAVLEGGKAATSGRQADRQTDALRRYCGSRTEKDEEWSERGQQSSRVDRPTTATTGTGNEGRRQLPLHYALAREPCVSCINLAAPIICQPRFPVCNCNTTTSRSQEQSLGAPAAPARTTCVT